jgi:hypothetical protein
MSAKSYVPKHRDSFKQEKENKNICYVHGGKYTLACSRTVHSSTVGNNSINAILKKQNNKNDKTI